MIFGEGIPEQNRINFNPGNCSSVVLKWWGVFVLNSPLTKKKLKKHDCPHCFCVIMHNGFNVISFSNFVSMFH